MSISQNFPNTRPSLNLNFARSKTLDPRITFTRTSSATYVDEDGLIKTAPANAPRFDHDPVTGECLGLLIEEQRENLLTRSEDLSTFWSQFLITSLTTNSIISPSGTLTADIVTFSNNQFSDVNHNTGFITNGTTYTLSVWARSVSGSSQFRLKYWNTSIGVYSDNIAVDETWKRYTYTFTATSTAGGSNIGFANSSDGTSKSVVFWGAQLEVGSFPTSYIPTSGSTATRTPDKASITGSNFSSWYNQSEGTIFCNFEGESREGTSGFKTKILYSISNGTFNNSNYVTSPESDGNLYFHMITNGSSQGIASIPSLQPFKSNFIYKSAYSIKNNDRQLSLNGSISTQYTSSTLPLVDRLYIGASWSGTGVYLGGHISQLTYYPVRLPNSQLQTLTK